jgi:hypothetical protein
MDFHRYFEHNRTKVTVTAIRPFGFGFDRLVVPMKTPLPMVAESLIRMRGERSDEDHNVLLFKQGLNHCIQDDSTINDLIRAHSQERNSGNLRLYAENVPVAKRPSAMLLILVHVCMNGRTADGQFLAVVLGIGTFQSIFDRGVALKQIGKEDEENVVYLVVENHHVRRIARHKDVIDSAREVMLVVMPDDQRSLDESSERLGQIVRKEKKNGEYKSRDLPSVIRLVAGERNVDFKMRVMDHLLMDRKSYSGVKILVRQAAMCFSVASSPSYRVLRDDEYPFEVFRSFDDVIAVEWINKGSGECVSGDRFLTIR